MFEMVIINYMFKISCIRLLSHSGDLECGHVLGQTDSEGLYVFTHLLANYKMLCMQCMSRNFVVTYTHNFVMVLYVKPGEYFDSILT